MIRSALAATLSARACRNGRTLLLLLVALAAPGMAQARPALCDGAARTAARATGVPLPVMRAITRVETGRHDGTGLAPWPWTVNMEGRGHWFATRAEAERFVAQAVARGARSFDIGCFQINHRWHGAAFASTEEMFDPERNALYAAQFLRRLHGEAGDWSVAAGWFHSRSPALSERYRARFERVRTELLAPEPAGPALTSRHAAAPPRPEAPNRFPLLTGQGAPGGHGSLVPLGGGARVPLLPALAAQGS